MLVTVKAGQVAAIEGDPGHPVTAGFLCAKAHALLERHYAPTRILHPMLRGPGGWRRISWQEAMHLMADKLARARDLMPNSVLHYHDYGSAGQLKALARRFFAALGGTTDATGSLCWAAGLAAQRYDLGYHLSHDPADLEHARLIILWGRDPSHTNRHLLPFLGHPSRIVLIDPGYPASAAVAQWRLRPRPGTDGALALAIASEVVRCGRADEEFLSRATLGYDGFLDQALAWTPQRAAEVTGLSAGDIAELARAYVAGPSAVLLGYGLQRYANSGQTVRAIDALAAVAGQLGRPGGGVSYANGWCGLTLASLASPQPGGGIRPGIPKAILAEQLLEPGGPDIAMLVVTGGNPVNQLPDANRTRQALAAIPFKVVMELRWSETAQEADLVLPVASWLEQEDLYTSSWHNYLTYGEQVLPPRGECRTELEVFTGLARLLDLPGGWERQAVDWVQLVLQPLGLPAPELKGTWFRHPTAPGVPWSDHRFLTPSGRFEFTSELAVKDGAPATAGYREPAEASASSPWAPRYPFHFLSPRHGSHTHSQFYAGMIGDDGLPLVYLHPDALTGLGILPGELVVVSSPRGALRGRAQPQAGGREDVVMVYEGGSVLDGIGANLLTPAGLTDLGLGARFYDCRCRVDRAEREVVCATGR
jgi:anaerobic selenocysteine-containing dehydrogenase